MRTNFIAIAVGLAVCLTPSLGRAQYPSIYSYGAWSTPTPYYVPGPIGYSTTYATPSGYRATYSTGVYPTPWGSNTYSTYNMHVRPIYSGPVHSVYWDPLANTYRYTGGFRNTPNYSYRFRYGF